MALGSAAPTGAGTYTLVASFAGRRYVCGRQQRPFTFTITQVTVTASATGTDKNYDGTTAATVVYGLSGVLPADIANVMAIGTANFASRGCRFRHPGQRS